MVYYDVYCTMVVEQDQTMIVMVTFDWVGLYDTLSRLSLYNP